MQWSAPELRQFDSRCPFEWFAYAEEEFTKHNITDWRPKSDLVVDNLTIVVRTAVQQTIGGNPTMGTSGGGAIVIV